MRLWVSTFQPDKTIRRVEKSIKTCQIAKILLAVLRGPKNPARVAATKRQHCFCEMMYERLVKTSWPWIIYNGGRKRGDGALRPNRLQPEPQSWITGAKREGLLRRWSGWVRREGNFFGGGCVCGGGGGEGCRSETRWGCGDESQRSPARTPVLTSRDGAGTLHTLYPDGDSTVLHVCKSDLSSSRVQVMPTLCARTCGIIQ